MSKIKEKLATYSYSLIYLRRDITGNGYQGYRILEVAALLYEGKSEDFINDRVSGMKMGHGDLIMLPDKDAKALLEAIKSKTSFQKGEE